MRMDEIRIENGTQMRWYEIKEATLKWSKADFQWMDANTHTHQTKERE